MSIKNSKPVELLEELNEQKRELSSKRIKSFFIIPAVVFMTFIFSVLTFNSVGWVFALTTVSLVASLIAYSIKVYQPFRNMVSQHKSINLEHFMSIYHPDTVYTYSSEELNGKKIIKGTKMLSANVFKEEDVMMGNYKDAQFYVSEMLVKQQSDKSSHTVFKGLLFDIKFSSKKFVPGKIKAKRGFFESISSSYIHEPNYDIWYKSHDEGFIDNIRSLLPFIKYLSTNEKEIKIDVKEDRLTILLPSDMELMDQPKQTYESDFVDPIYFETMGTQINTLLYITEAFVNGTGISQVEEKLELKSLNLIKNVQRKDYNKEA